MTQPTILIIASYPDSIVTFRGPLIESMLRRGHDVHVAAPDLPSGSLVRILLEEKGVVVHNIPLRRTGTNVFADVFLFWRLFKLMRRTRPSLVLGYTIKPVVYGSLAAWLSRVPHRFALVTGLGYAFTGNRRGFLTGLVERLYAFALSRVHKVFFQNPDDQALFRERGILPHAIPSVVVNGSGVDLLAFPVEPFPAGPPCFLMIGRLLGDKGAREFADAARIVHKSHPQVRFRLVGWIDNNPDAVGQSELDAWISGGAIEFLGKLDDVRPAIAVSTVYVLPSYREGTPRTVLEALATGRPVITTDAPGCRETVIDGENGFLVPVRSVDALVGAMLRFVEDDTLAPRMGAKSRRIAEEKYDVHKVNDVMLYQMDIAPVIADRIKEHE